MEDNLLKKHGFFFKKQFGQNFLSDTNLLRAIALDAGVDKTVNVLEIGAGAGALTRILSEEAKRVLSYEIDKSLKPVLEESLSGCENVEVVLKDFAKEDLKQIERALGSYTVVANLPYYLTTPIILRFVEESKTCTGLTVMVQEEVADRMCAKAGESEYGALTAAIARKGSAKITRRVSKELFMPRPKVDSAVVRIDFSQGGFAVADEKAYRATVRCAFLNRRKTLENNLMGAFSLSRDRAKEILASVGIPEGVRGETLSPETLGKLSDALFLGGIVKS